MQTIIQVEPNEWVTEQLLIAVTGLKPALSLGRKNSWLLDGNISTFHQMGNQSPPANACTTVKRLTHGLPHKNNQYGDRVR
jgi:hypothetical protein